MFFFYKNDSARRYTHTHTQATVQGIARGSKPIRTKKKKWDGNSQNSFEILMGAWVRRVRKNAFKTEEIRKQFKAKKNLNLK